MSGTIAFDSNYYNEGVGYNNYRDFPHFAQRANWLNKNLSGSIFEIGCGYGYLLHHLTLLNKENFGIDNSIYAETKVDSEVLAKFERIDIKDYSVGVPYDWCVSWNVLDCLKDDDDAVNITTKINTFANNQLHIICMSKQSYIDQGYFIRDYAYWRNLLPNAYLVDYETSIVYVPNGFRELSEIPLGWGSVSN